MGCYGDVVVETYGSEDVSVAAGFVDGGPGCCFFVLFLGTVIAVITFRVREYNILRVHPFDGFFREAVLPTMVCRLQKENIS